MSIVTGRAEARRYAMFARAEAAREYNAGNYEAAAAAVARANAYDAAASAAQ